METESVTKAREHVANGGGLCGTCLAPATATAENEGYSYCCNDRIEYGSEAIDSLNRHIFDDATGEVIAILGSWGQVERFAKIQRRSTYRGKESIEFIGETGSEGLMLASKEGEHYGWRLATDAEKAEEGL